MDECASQLENKNSNSLENTSIKLDVCEKEKTYLQSEIKIKQEYITTLEIKIEKLKNESKFKEEIANLKQVNQSYKNR